MPYTASFSSQLMQNFVLENPFSPQGGRLCSFRDANSTLRLISWDDGTLSQVYSDRASSTGWSFQPLLGNHPQVVALLAGNDTLGNAFLLVVQTDQFYFAVLNSPSSTGFINLGGPGPGIVAAAVGQSPAGHLLALLGKQKQSSYSWFLYDLTNSFTSFERGGDDPLDLLAQGSNTNTLSGLALGVVDGNVIVACADGTGLMAYPASSWQNVPNLANQAVAGLTGVSDWQTHMDLFGQDSENVLTHWAGQASGWATETLPQTVTNLYSQLAAGTNAAGELELFAVAGTLFHMRQAQGQWTALLDLGIVAEALSVAENGAGNMDAFVLQGDGVLYVQEDPVADDWSTSAIELPATQTLQILATYSTEITLLDARGNPQPSIPLGLYASDPVYLLVNGQGYAIDSPDRPITVETNLAGRLDVVYPATSLRCPDLQLVGEDMESYTFGPYGGIEETLAQVTPASLTSALPSLEGNPNLAEVVQILTTFTGIPKQPGARFYGQLDTAAMHQRFWIRRTPDGPSLRWLAPAEAAPDLRAELSGFDWGDLWESIVDGVSTVTDIIAQGSSVQIYFVMDGISQLFSGLLQTTQQLLDVVTEVFAWVGVQFEQLFQWLGYIFDPDAISNTQQALLWTVDQFLSFLSQTVNSMSISSAQVASLVQSLQSAFSSFQGIPAFTTLQEPFEGSFILTGSVPIDAVASAFFDNLDGLETGGVAAALPADGLSALDNAWNQLVASIESLASVTSLKSYIAEFQDSAATLLENPLTALCNLVAAACSDLLTLGVGLVNQVLSALASLIETVQGYLNSTFYVPVVSELYELFTGEPSSTTVLEVLTFILAAGATVAYKIANDGAAPFSDELLADYQQGYTVAALQAAFQGNGGSSEIWAGTGVEAGGPIEVWKAVGQVMMSVLGGMLTFVMLPLQVAADLSAVTGSIGIKTPAWLDGTLLAGEWLQAVLSAPWLWSLSPTAPGCGSVEGFTGTMWILQAFMGPFVDTITLAVSQKLAWLASDFGCIYSTATGAVSLGLAIYLAVLESDAGSYSSMETAINVCSTLPSLCRWLRSTPVAEGSYGISLAVLALVEGVTAGFTGTASIVTALDPSGSEQTVLAGRSRLLVAARPAPG